MTSPGKDCVYNYQPASRRSLAQLASNSKYSSATSRKSSMDHFTSWLPRRKRSVSTTFYSLSSFPYSEHDLKLGQMPSQWKTYNLPRNTMEASGMKHTVLDQNNYPCIYQRSQREEQLHSQVYVMHGGGCRSDQSRQSNIGHSLTFTYQVSTNQNTVSTYINQSHHVGSL